MNLLEQVAALLRGEFNKIYNGTKSVYNSIRLGNKTLATVESERDTAISGAITTNVTDKLGAANGIATLDGTGKVPTTQLPASVVGALNYKGAFDASGGSYPATPSQGDYWVVSVAGTVSSVEYDLGDWIVYNGTSWDKIDNVVNLAEITSQIGTYAEFETEFNDGLLTGAT